MTEVKGEEKKQGSGTGMWPEVRKAMDEKRFEICLIGSEISARIESNGGFIDSNVYRVSQLNLLEVAKTKLSTLPKQISQLKNLTSLVFHTNELTVIPKEIGELKQLKNLDLSNNKLTSLPTEINNCKELFTVNLSGNELSNDGQMFSFNGLNKLSLINISQNKFKTLPMDADNLGAANLDNLKEINASFNELTALPEDLPDLPVLKTLNCSNNQILVVPSNLSQCIKMKDLLLKTNKIKDNRLKKLVEQDVKQKSLMDYLKKLYDEEMKSKPKKKAKAKVTPASKKNSQKDADLAAAVVEYDRIEVTHFNDEKTPSKTITIADSVNQVRPHIVCAILRNLDLASGLNFKKFLTIQTKIQDTKCEKRTLATIATHDLASITSASLTYEATEPDDIQLIPLGFKYPIKATDYYGKLLDEAEAERKLKKRNQVTGVHKYLSLLENQKTIAFLRDDAKTVLSLPPLTNSEKTRMSTSTKDILIEITSGESVAVCKQVMELLLSEMLTAGLVSSPESDELVEQMGEMAISKSKQQLEEDQENNEKLRHRISMQQVKTVDATGNLKTVYPSRVDLNFEDSNKIRTVRLYDE